MLASLGLFVFETSTALFDGMNRHREWKHPSAERYLQLDGSQFTGPGDDMLRLTGRIVPEVAGAYTSIDTLAAMADQGDAAALINGAGTIIGNFVIVSLDEQHTAIFDGGVARCVGFALELKRVPDDPAPPSSAAPASTDGEWV
ncbi:phage tail protein [Novosphingobium rosa]|uniref:phage tail protein n=1 Tax=Novosphingobium rosa TaxID=76978 RepID=UPI000832F643|nr:phage tail protein [Novosphingobium rosa]